MLNSQDMSLIVRVRAYLGQQSGQPAKALGAELDALLVAHTAHAASVAAARSARPPNPLGGRPAVRYRVEVEPGWIEYAQGAKAAHAAVLAALAKLGEPGKYVPAPNSMSVQLSRKGQWFTLVETANGTVSISVAKAEESGTEIVSSKTRAKKTKTT